MVPNRKHAIINFMTITLWSYFVIQESRTEKVAYVNLERPFIDYYDPLFFANLSTSSRRFNRTDSHHYFTLEFDLLNFDPPCTHSFSFYELVSVSSKRRIVQLHYDVCDWAQNDNFFGLLFREAFKKIPKAERPMPEFKCPFVPGRYSLRNMQISPQLRMPVSFPFQDGRIYYNLACKQKCIAKSHIDFQIAMKNA